MGRLEELALRRADGGNPSKLPRFVAAACEFSIIVHVHNDRKHHCPTEAEPPSIPYGQFGIAGLRGRGGLRRSGRFWLWRGLWSRCSRIVDGTGAADAACFCVLMTVRRTRS